MKKIVKYLKRFISVIIVMTLGLIWLVLGISCEKAEITRSIDGIDYTMTEDSILIKDTVKNDDKPGISFDIESDSLKEEIENIYFHPKEWEEEDTDIDL